MPPGTTAQLLAAAGVLATVIGLMALNSLMGRTGRAAAAPAVDAPRAPGGVRYVVHAGRVLGAIVGEKDGRLLIESGSGDKFVVAADRVKPKDGEWVLAGDWDAEGAKAAAAGW